MPVSYEYTGRLKDGERVKGGLKVDSRERALEILSGRSVIVTSLNIPKPKLSNPLKEFFRPDFSQEVVLFSRHLATYHRSGIPILKALSLIKVGKAQERFQLVLRDIRQKVTEGKPLSAAMHEYPDVFSDVFVNSVEAGETSGQLATILDDTAEALERELELRRQIRSSLRYPVMVLIAISFAFIIIMTLVIPKFAAFYDKFDADLPGPTLLMIWVSDFVIQNWHLALGLAGSLFYGFRRYINSKNGRKKWDRFLLNLPVFGPLIIKTAVARFALLFRILFRSGIPLIKSLSILESSMPNVHLKMEVARMRESFEAGRELESRTENSYFPEMSLNMIKSGLESGSLELMLEEIGKHYSREVTHTSKNLASLIEPAMTVLIGGLVLTLALAIFLPMWNLIKVFR